MFVSGPPTDVLGDFGVYIDGSHNVVLVWANIDNPSNYSVGATIASHSKKFPWHLFMQNYTRKQRKDK